MRTRSIDATSTPLAIATAVVLAAVGAIVVELDAIATGGFVDPSDGEC